MGKRKINVRKDGSNKSISDVENISHELTDDVGVKVVNELMTSVRDENIDIKTDLSDYETKLITRLIHIYHEFRITRGQTMLIHLMRLKLSKARKSRKEIIDVAKADKQHEIDTSFWGKTKDFFKGK